MFGDFDEEQIKNEVEKRLKKKEKQGEIKRIFEKEKETVKIPRVEVEMEVSIPLFIFGYKIKPYEQQDIVKRHVAIEIILELLIGKSSSTYQKLYNEGLLINELDLEYEFEKSYAYIAIGRSKPKS